MNSNTSATVIPTVQAGYEAAMAFLATAPEWILATVITVELTTGAVVQLEIFRNGDVRNFTGR